MVTSWGAMGPAAVAAAMVAAALAAATPRRWLGRTMLLWVALPAFTYTGVVAWELMTRPGPSYPAGTALYGFVLINAVAVPSWLLVCLAGFALGFGTRLLVRPMIRLAGSGMEASPRPQPAVGLATNLGAVQTSADGAIRVEFAETEWANSHWVNSPRVVETASGRIVLDLWNSDWDAVVSFPAPWQVSLSVRRYTRPATLVAVLDLRADTYWTTPGSGGEAVGPAPLSGVAAGLETATSWAGQGVTPPRPHPLAAWRTALLILAGSAIAIAAGAVLLPQTGLRERVPGPVLTPMPVMPHLDVRPNQSQSGARP